jgi:hypothetical protein
MAQWIEIIQERNASGKSIKAYCESKDISRDSFFYWQRKLRDATSAQLARIQAANPETCFSQTNFTEIKLRGEQNPMRYEGAGNSNSLFVETQGIKLTAGSSYPADKLGYLLRELARQ